jgi:hypothetical protein
MLLKGEAVSVEAAFAAMKATRTLVGIQPQQRAVLTQAEAILARTAGLAAAASGAAPHTAV